MVEGVFAVVLYAVHLCLRMMKKKTKKKKKMKMKKTKRKTTKKKILIVFPSFLFLRFRFLSVYNTENNSNKNKKNSKTIEKTKHSTCVYMYVLQPILSITPVDSLTLSVCAGTRLWRTRRA